MISLDLFALLTMTSVEWSSRDTLSMVAVSLGVVSTLLVAQRKDLSIRDPMVKGYLAVLFKGVPQLILAYEIMLWGGQGVATLAIISGHATIISRLGQLWFSIKEAGWDRNRIGSAISEIANEGSWIIVTIVWLF